MLQEINTWADYRSRVREFDAVLEHGKAVASALAGMTATTPRIGYGAQIFIKLLSHCIALRSMAADPNKRSPRELLDIPSMCAITRCVVEAHDAFEYIAGHEVTDVERAFRVQLWELQDKTRLLKLLDRDDLRADIARRRRDLEVHEFFTAMPTRLQALLSERLAKGDPPAFHLNQRKRCEASGVNADWHSTVALQLAQHVHTLPSAMHQLFELKPDTPEALRQMALPLLVALPLLARLIQAMEVLIPSKVPKPPSRTARTMALWRAETEGNPGV
ncbi:hypothetical protein ACS5PN_21245 [Roseateles sp. NT4]|uniref:hypothetical protein n=1 Tax=Roseateles sp. NT4 TaxID=3453715 RepID=UPI003EEC0DC9